MNAPEIGAIPLPLLLGDELFQRRLQLLCTRVIGIAAQFLGTHQHRHGDEERLERADFQRIVHELADRLAEERDDPGAVPDAPELLTRGVSQDAVQDPHEPAPRVERP